MKPFNKVALAPNKNCHSAPLMRRASSWHKNRSALNPLSESVACMSNHESLDSYLKRRRISRRAFLQYCSVIASVLALPPGAIPALADNLRRSIKPPVIWLSFQECTGCTESLSRSDVPTIEDLMFDFLSLDYHHTLQAASGEAAESAREKTFKQSFGKYILIVDGSIPVAAGGVYSTIAGRTNLDMLEEAAKGASMVIAVGSCSAFGGIAAASPNPTGATGISELMDAGLIPRKPLVNLPGCPPLPISISSVLANMIAFGRLPELDNLKRPLSIYGKTVHERCSRLRYFRRRRFARSFDDYGAKQGWCLFKLGCKGPVSHNACAVFKWNQGTSFPIGSGHPCLGCSEPGFWDKGSFYRQLRRRKGRGGFRGHDT